MASGPIDNEHTMEVSYKLDIDIWNHDRSKPYEQIGYLDTQAAANFISQEMSDFLGHERMQYDGPGFFGAGNPDVVPIGQINNVYFTWKKSPTRKLHQETFVVLKELPYNIILGMAFLKTHKALLLNAALLPLALKPASKIEKNIMQQSREANKAQQEADEEAERAKGREERERQRQKQAQVLQAKDQSVVLTK
ncbi:hypothetical protein F5B22DRAFT_645713 [Xylaria bambusicola]|uniref:uncharacterized protein n=1 Tax=Xylaria bambusicola TaxID=326684 RepID=UPI0020084E1D|nr:uncharacterized protein F5B22DRAFT_645713 [Xylaria bambusicola]KAI0517529.1 hypothetical protein F5B22DRAFT_645713 [Xylaria bambusicola]